MRNNMRQRVKISEIITSADSRAARFPSTAWASGRCEGVNGSLPPYKKQQEEYKQRHKTFSESCIMWMQWFQWYGGYRGNQLLLTLTVYLCIAKHGLCESTRASEN